MFLGIEEELEGREKVKDLSKMHCMLVKKSQFSSKKKYFEVNETKTSMYETSQVEYKVTETS